MKASIVIWAALVVLARVYATGQSTSPAVAITTPDTCVDKSPHCPDLGPFYCTPTFKPWSEINCRKSCGFCGPKLGIQKSAPSQITVRPLPTALAFCQYKGQSYSQGQSWQDGCLYNCSCEDAANGYHRCKNLCPDYYQIPPDCHLITVQGQCCPILNCSLSAGPDIITDTKYCRYNGDVYRQDETWKVGCAQSCKCTDESRGLYQCGSVCLNWDGLPGICHLDDAPPGHCCKQPKCPAGVIINIPIDYKNEYPKTENPSYNYV